MAMGRDGSTEVTEPQLSPEMGIAELSNIAEKITAITSFHPSHNDSPEHVSGTRQLLNELVALKVFKMASLWKIKQESHTMCARERTDDYFNPDPQDPDMCNEFVFNYRDSFLRDVIENEKFSEGSSLSICSLHDPKYANDSFFVNFLKRVQTSVKTVILLPMRAHRRHPRYKLSYILVVYVDPAVTNDRVNDAFMRAIANKISSTLYGQLEVSTNEITRNVIEIARGNEAVLSPDLGSIMMSFVNKIIPQYFKSNSIIAAWVQSEVDGLDNQYGYSARHHDGSVISLSAAELSLFIDVCKSCRDQVTVLLDLKNYGENCSIFKGSRSAIIGRIESRGNRDLYGFVVLVDKACPLALRIRPGVRILDIFDWEDQFLMTHTILLASMLAEMTHDDVRRRALAAKYTHEIATPTFIIASELDAILNNPHSGLDDKTKNGLARIRSHARLQLEMTTGVLFTYRNPSSPPAERYALPAKKLKLSKRLVSLSGLAEECKDLVVPYCTKMNVDQRRILIDQRLPQLLVDRAAFRQVFLNLFLNAIKYKGTLSYDRFRILVSWDFAQVGDLAADINDSETHDYIDAYASTLLLKSDLNWHGGHLIRVEDDGIGIPTGWQRRIFERGERAPNVRAWNVTGNGFGLAIVRQILEEHFGAIWVDRNGSPTRINMFLPAILRRDEYTLEPAWTGQAIR